MNVTINDAMSAFIVLRDNMNENSFLHECFNIAISACKTIQDGNYKLDIYNVPRETLLEIANYDCRGKECDGCIYKKRNGVNGLECMSVKAKHILYAEEYMKEVSEWIKNNSMN